MLHRRIRVLREGRGLTQAQTGAAIGVPQRTYAYYETGQRTVTPQVLIALADFYGVSADYLLGRAALVSEKDPAPTPGTMSAQSGDAPSPQDEDAQPAQGGDAADTANDDDAFPARPLPRMRELRLAEKVSEEEIAGFLGISEEVYGRYERGEKEPPLAMLAGIAEYYGVCMDYLAGLTTKRAPYPQA